jgi:hypothetical protein
MPLAAHQTPRADAAPSAAAGSGLSRREVLVGAGGTGLLAVGAGVLRVPAASAAARTASAGDGAPEQVHLTWGNDPATSVVVSWASPGRAVRPRVLLDRGSMRDPATGCGVAVFGLGPGEPGGETSITVIYHHAAGADPANPSTGAAGTPDPDCTPFETFTLVRPRSDGHDRHSRGAATGQPVTLGEPGLSAAARVAAVVR